MTDSIDDNSFNDKIKEIPPSLEANVPLNKTGKKVTPSSLVRENIRIKKDMAILSHDLHVLRNNNALLQKSINELKKENKDRLKEIEVLRQFTLKLATAFDILSDQQGKSKKQR